MSKDFESSHLIQLGSIAGRLERIKEVFNARVRSGSINSDFRGIIIKALDTCINETGSISIAAKDKPELKEVATEAEVLKMAAWTMLDYILDLDTPFLENIEVRELTTKIYHDQRIKRCLKEL